MSFELLWWAVPVVLSFMPLHNVLQIVGAALTEHKVCAHHPASMHHVAASNTALRGTVPQVLIVGGSVCMDAVSSVALCMVRRAPHAAHRRGL